MRQHTGYQLALLRSIFEDIVGVPHVRSDEDARAAASVDQYWLTHMWRDDPDYAQRAKAFSASVRDFAEIIAELGPVAPRHPVQAVAAYHDACHLAHAQGIRDQPRELLRAVPGLEVREIPDGEICCGSAGVWNILNPGPARELGDRKAANIATTGASLLITANPGCLMQVATSLQRTGHTIALTHTAMVLDASIRGVPLETL